MRRAGRVIKRVLRIFAILLFAGALCLTLLLIFQKVFEPFRVVESGSMEPNIMTGDAIVIKDLDAKKIKAGDIIIFNDPEKSGQFVIHRVVAIDEGDPRFFHTKGDRNPAEDPERIAAGEVIGGVAVKVPSFGKFIDFLETPKGYVVLIGIPAAVAMFLILVLAIFDRSGREQRYGDGGYGPRPPQYPYEPPPAFMPVPPQAYPQAPPAPQHNPLPPDTYEPPPSYPYENIPGP